MLTADAKRGKLVLTSLDWLWFCFSCLDQKVTRFLSQSLSTKVQIAFDTEVVKVALFSRWMLLKGVST